MRNNKELYLVLIVLALIVLKLNNGAGLGIEVNEILDERLKGGEIDPMYEEILPEAGHCTDQGVEVDYGTHYLDGERTPREYCRIDKFCEVYEASIVLDSGEYDEAKLQNIIDANPNKVCFTEEATHTQRNWISEIPSDDSLKVKYACCTGEDPEEQNNCESNTCNGRYTGVRDAHNCRIYAVQEGDSWVSGCGGFHSISVS